MKIFFAAAGRDVDDARAFFLADVRPTAMTRCSTPLRGGQLVERAGVAPLEHVRAAQMLHHFASLAQQRTSTSASASRHCTLVLARRSRRSDSGFTAAATLAVSVQGVVVQTSRLSSGRSSSGKRTYRLVWVTSVYPSVSISMWLMPVPQRGHQGMTSWPLYSQPCSWQTLIMRQMV